MLLAITMLAENFKTSNYKKKKSPIEVINVQLQEVEFHDENITDIVHSCIPEIINTCKIESKAHYVRMSFRNGNPTQFVMYPEILQCHFTIDFWMRNRKDILGYLYVDDMLVIVQGKKAKKFVKKKKAFKVINIENYPPSNAKDWSYWCYTLIGNDVIKEKHITKTPQILF